jgi:hypothetical protein
MKKAILASYKILSTEISVGSQSVEFTELLSGWGQRLRVSIKSDSHSFQSYARIDVWSPVELKWHNVASIHHGSMGTQTGLIYLPSKSGVQAVHFQADRIELLRLAGLILCPVV